MVLSRVWVLLLAVAAVAAAAAALLAQGMVNRHYDAQLESDLRRDRFEVEQTLRLDARARIDAIAPIAAEQEVRSLLHQATQRRDDTGLAALNGPLKTKLHQLNDQLAGMKGDIVFAVANDGTVIAQLGPSEPRFGANLVTFPLVERALAGYVRDDVWVYDGQVYRMAARPVIDGGVFVGAIIHGKKLDADLAQILSTRLNGATVAFFRGDAIIAAYAPADVPGAPDQSLVGAPLAGLAHDEHLAAGERTDPVDLQGRGRGVYALVTGSAADARVGYVIARNADHLASPIQLFQRSTTDDFKKLPLPYLGGAGFLVFLFGMIWIWLERDRPLGKMKRATAALAARQVDRLDIAAHGGSYRRIAENVNGAIDKAVEQASEMAPKKKANLDDLLGPAPSGAGQPQAFFAFGGPSASGGAADEIPDIPPAPAAPPPRQPPPMAAPPMPAAAPPMAAPPPPKPAFAPPPPKPAGGGYAPPPPAPKPAGGGYAPPPPAPPTTAPRAAPTGGVPKGTLIGLPMEPSASSGGGPVQAASLPPHGDFDDDDGATKVARVPEALLTAAATGRVSAVSPDAAEEEMHFRQVFEDFVAKKKECGEPTAGFTYDKFVQTLRKNKEAIVSKHAARSVRFTVYIKDGKAALKATPVKD